FATACDAVCDGLAAELGRDPREVVHAGPGTPAAAEIDRTGYAQTGLFAWQVAMFRLLESWGVVPDVLAGHSIGELSAAHLAGVWSLPDACRVVAARATAMQELPAGGAMLSLRASEATVGELVDGIDRVDVAAVNGPDPVV